MNIPIIEHSRSKIFWAWINIIFDKVEILLIFGFGAIALSPWVDWLRLDQAGAVLTAASITATVFHQNNIDETYKNLKAELGEQFKSLSYRQEKDPDTKDITWKKVITTAVKFDPSLHTPDIVRIDPTASPWYIISKKHMNTDGLLHWVPSVVVKRINYIETWCIAISALIGTFLWAFGNNC